MGIIQDLLDLKDSEQIVDCQRKAIEAAIMEIDNQRHEVKALQAKEREVKRKINYMIDTYRYLSPIGPTVLAQLQEIDLMLGGQDETA